MDNTKGFFYSDNGNRSYSRLSGFLLILAYIAWGSYIMYIKNIVIDIPPVLAGTVLTLYGLNKVLSKNEQPGKTEDMIRKEDNNATNN